MNTTPFHRIQWTLRLRRSTRLPFQQHAVLYALLCAAHEREGVAGTGAIPEGVFLDAPEAARTEIDAGETYTFGASLIANDRETAAALARGITEGLERVGRDATREGVALGGNFDVVGARDLVADRAFAAGDVPEYLPQEWIARELDRLVEADRPLTLRFLSPLRLELPAGEARRGHQHADEAYLNAGQLLRAVRKRLLALGIRRVDGGPEIPFSDDAITLLENRLVWLDLEYGRHDARKSLGGAMGRIVARVNDPDALAALVWGQYARVGRNLRFGLGRYRVEELGPDPTEARRALPLLDLCLASAGIEAVSRDLDLDPSDVREAADRLRRGDYAIAPPRRVTLRELDGGTRVLQVPSRIDRALQRLILGRLSPAIDGLLETSSYAWRKGLSRDAAAMRIERLANDGWRHAVRADIDRFFQEVPQEMLRERLEAVLGDDATAGVILRFVTAGLPEGRGIATGAPLSPLCGNLLLDRFDEQIEAEGGRLVRYADDFLILSRRREEAERLHDRARQLVADLELRLNDDATVLDLREPFTFLGFEFRQEERWRYDGPDGPRLVRELGRRDADRTPSPLSLRLPGESDDGDGSAGGVVVVGPGIEAIETAGDALLVYFRDGRQAGRVSLDGVDRLVLLGPARWESDLPGLLLRAGVVAQIVSEGGWPLGELLADPPEDPEALLAQARAVADPALALCVARALVAAKLRNHAALLLSVDAGQTAPAAKLRGAADDAEAAGSLDSLRGIEGAGAAAWYRALPSLLGRGFRFDRRVAPDAHDPVNVLLNLGHTMLYRHAMASCRAAGLSPSLGFLHVPSPRFAALAADLQEPFRHLVERAAIVATRRLRPNQFLRRDDGPHALVLEHRAARAYHAILQRSWRVGVVGRGQAESRAWLGQMVGTARALRRHLVDPEQPWSPFEHAEDTP